MLCTVHTPPELLTRELPQYVSSTTSRGGPEVDTGGLVWSNRNDFTGPNDNGIDDVWSDPVDRAKAIAVIDAALAAWRRVLPNFRQDGGNDQIDISISMYTTGAGFGGEGGPTSLIGNKPRTGYMLLGRGDDTNNDGLGDGGQWFLDPTPNENSEFGSDQIINAFASKPRVGMGIAADLFTLVTVEFAHVLGLANNMGLAWRQNANGYLQNTFAPDQRDAPGTLWAFNSPTVRALMTTNNGGNGGADTGLPVHTSFPPNSVLHQNRTYSGVSDVGTAGGDADIRYMPSDIMGRMLSVVYGYDFVPPERFGTFYAQLEGSGKLNISTDSDNIDDIDLQVAAGNLLVTHTIGTPVPGLPATYISTFPLSSVTSIDIDTVGGNDILTLSTINASVPIKIFMGTGNDTLRINGSSGYDAVVADFGTITTTGINITSHSGVDQLDLNVGLGNADLWLTQTGSLDGVSINAFGGDEVINLHTLNQFTPATIFGNGGNDTIYLGADGNIGAAVLIDGGAGNDTFHLAPSNFASVTISQPVTVFGGADNDTLVLGSNNADSVDTNIVFDGGTHAGPIGDRFVINDTAVFYNVSYTVSNTVVTRDGFNLPHTISYSNTEGIVLNCGFGGDTLNLGNAIAATVDMHLNDGNDILNVGGGNMTGYFPQIFNGGDGNDRITFDNRFDATNRIWDMRNNEVIFGGLISLFTTNFESVGVLGGTGFDEFDFKGILVQGFVVDGGGGGDDFVLGHQGSVYFNNAVTLTGGAGPDLFTVNDAAVNSAFYAPLVMDGGDATEFNGLVVNEPLITNYELGPGYFSPQGQGTFAFANMTATTLTGNSAANNFTIYSAGASIGTFTINGGSGDDSFVLAPQISGYSFKGLTINGQPGTDTFRLEATALNTNESYTIGTNSLTIARGGALFDTVNISSMNSVTVNCGLGNDTISMNQYSAGIPVTVNGGIGDDTMNIGGGNLSANITNIAAFMFSGQNGFDRFNVNNTAEFSQWQYIRDTGTIRADRLAPLFGYFVILGEDTTEEVNVNAGGNGDSFYVRANPVGTSTIINAGDGLDGLVLADSTQNLSGIRGLVRYNAGAGGGNVLVSDNADATGDVGHLTETTLGAVPGDNLFGAGGWLEFNNIVNFGAFPGITLNLSSSADTIYATPLASARVTINGGNPPAATGDILNLALGAAVNYVINGTIATGNVTSTNLQTLNWTGFETGPNVDAEAPVAVGFDLDLGAAAGPETPQSISAFFSEGVLSVTAASLSLVNTTTGQTVPASDIAVSSNFDTFTFTFPNYSGGALPDGAYLAQILGAGITDLFGNAVSGNSAIESFIWSAGTSGNDVYRVIRDPGAFNYLVYLNDDVTPAFFSPAATTSRIVLAGGDGDDSLTVDFTNGNLGAPLYDLKFYGGADNDTIGVIGSTADDHANFYDGSLQLNSSEINFTGAESVTWDGGGGADVRFSINEISVTLIGSQRFANLIINAGAAALMQEGSDSILVAQQLTMAPTARLDLADNAMVLDYTGASQLTAMLNLSLLGRNGGTWDGYGITSSNAAADATTALGFGEATHLYSAFPADFLGESVDDTSILLRYTLDGDANLDRTVGLDDFNILASHFNTSGKVFAEGDFTFDNNVNLDDFNILAARFGVSLATQGARARGESLFGRGQMDDEQDGLGAGLL